MPLPAIAAAAIPALAGLQGNVLNLVAGEYNNRRTREHQEKMYARQRADNLADWNMMNQYNSPEAQMRRYKEAGLNPNLIYGQQNMSPAIKSADTQNWSPIAPQVDTSMIGEAVNQYFNVQRFNSEMETAQKQRQLIDKQIELTQNKALTELEQPSYVNAKKMLTIEDKWTKAIANDYAQETKEINKKMLNNRNSLLEAQYQVAHQNIKNMKQNLISSRDANNRANQLQPYVQRSHVLKNILTEYQSEESHERKKQIEENLKKLQLTNEKLQLGLDMMPIDKALEWIGKMRGRNTEINKTYNTENFNYKK